MIDATTIATATTSLADRIGKDGDANPVDRRSPDRLEAVQQDAERERRHRLLFDPGLGEPRRQRRADHRIGKALADAEEQGRHRCPLEVRTNAVEQAGGACGRRHCTVAVKSVAKFTRSSHRRTPFAFRPPRAGGEPA